MKSLAQKRFACSHSFEPHAVRWVRYVSGAMPDALGAWALFARCRHCGAPQFVVIEVVSP